MSRRAVADQTPDSTVTWRGARVSTDSACFGSAVARWASAVVMITRPSSHPPSATIDNAGRAGQHVQRRLGQSVRDEERGLGQQPAGAQPGLARFVAFLGPPPQQGRSLPRPHPAPGAPGRRRARRSPRPTPSCRRRSRGPPARAGGPVPGCPGRPRPGPAGRRSRSARRRAGRRSAGPALWASRSAATSSRPRLTSSAATWASRVAASPAVSSCPWSGRRSRISSARTARSRPDSDSPRARATAMPENRTGSWWRLGVVTRIVMTAHVAGGTPVRGGGMPHSRARPGEPASPPPRSHRGETHDWSRSVRSRARGGRPPRGSERRACGRPLRRGS